MAEEEYQLQRSRNGCLTCRARRVKCDELRPICSRCAAGNRQVSNGLATWNDDEHTFPAAVTFPPPPHNNNLPTIPAEIGPSLSSTLPVTTELS